MGSERSMKSEVNIIETSESWMYLVKSKALGYELAEDWMLFWTFFMPIALIISFFLKENMLIYKGLLYIIFIFAMTVIRRNIVGSFKYLLANTTIVLFAFIISFTLIEKIIFLIPIIFCFVISIKKRRSEVIEFYKINFLLWSEILMVICYFIAFNYKLKFIMNLINFASINVAITCALYVCISRMERLMEWEGEFVKGYSKRMRSIRLGSIAFISGVIIFLVLVAWRIGLYKLLDMLTSKILASMNGTQSYKVQPEKIKPQTNSAPVSINDSLKNLESTGKSSYLMTTILNIVQFIILATLALLAIYLLFKLVIKVMNFYKGLRLKKPYKKEEREFIISLEDVVKEIKDRADRFRAGLELPFNMSNSKKIRKLYHKLIKSYKIKGILAYSFNTPIEIESKIRETLEKNISEATVIYEKARYSDIECNEEEVNRMKSFFTNK